MLSEAEARRRLDDLTFLPLTLSVPGVPARVSGEADWEIEVIWREWSFTFAVEYLAVATPRRLENAIGRVRRLESGERLPMVVAPYLSEKALTRLTDARMSGIDFCGNGVVQVPGSLFVYRAGAPNRFPSSAPIQAIYDGTSSLVGRVLVDGSTYRRVKDVREAVLRRGGSISMSTVSKVLKGMEEDLLVQRDDNIRALQPGRLLDALTDGYGAPAVTQRFMGRSAVPPLEALRRLTGEDNRISAIVRADGRYVPFPGSEEVPTIYCKDLGAFLDSGQFEEDPRFPELRILETSDQRVYFDAEWDADVPWTSPVQTYLDLMEGGKRERDVAEDLRPLVLGVR